MRKLFFILTFLYGMGLSCYFGVWGIRDMKALEKSVSVGAQHEEIRHRMNVSAEGNWFLLSNIISIIGVLGTIEINKNK